MNRPQLTSIHFVTPTVTTTIVSYTSNTLYTETNNIIQKIFQWWQLLSTFEQTSILLNVSAVIGIIVFICYLFVNKYSRKIKGKNIYVHRNGAYSYGF